MNDARCRAFADRLGAIVVSVEYRLAPEYPFPIPLEDCYTGLLWLAAYPDLDADRIAIGGDSAGGGLTAALAILARDRGRIHPIMQLLVLEVVPGAYHGFDRVEAGAEVAKAFFRAQVAALSAAFDGRQPDHDNRQSRDNMWR